jgi:tetratricopeptide (TPR) repeat protein
MNLGKGMAAELAASAPTNPNSAQEAQTLLKASLALRIGVPRLATTWARQALKARPTCQWAAAIAFRSEADPNARQEISDLLKPDDCTLRRLLAAEIRQDKGDFARAAELFAQAAQNENGDPIILLSQAVNTEYAGKLAPALELYRQVWQSSKLPAAANNVAYTTLRLYPKDSAKLAEAQGLVAEALRQMPQEATFLDTLGWISYLRGQYEQASGQLRQAVRANPQAPENHYHLAMAESACGRNDLARWHHQAAINIVKAMIDKAMKNAKATDEAEKKKEAEKQVSPDALKAAGMAQEALDALGPGK